MDRAAFSHCTEEGVLCDDCFDVLFDSQPQHPEQVFIIESYVALVAPTISRRVTICSAESEMDVMA
ncbi:hypothetical protein ACQR5U_11170 [Xanthomonas oryzae pv. oryzicola]|uniref:hypothetical protein n=1 Tax=Xanthomonas oryzae TaxID=347 RepID=UPI0018A29C76|nr:hypothetical protein [Xanthomonas oryzae]